MRVDTAIGREGQLADCALGPYRLRRVLGEGGSSFVYEAEDTVLGRRVAVKVARSPERYTECRRDFERQCRTIGARIDHPCIVRIYGGDLHEGTPYLAMELVEGQTLYRLLQKRLRLRWEEALRIGRDAAEALAAAHRLGVVHRDLKPDNILVTTSGRAKLTDFYAEDGDSLINDEGTYDYFGTPGYSAPEQVRGDEERIDGRSDLFALGVILYEMMEGEPLHGQGETTRVLARTLARGGAPKLKASRDVPGHVARLVNRLVQSNPRRRPADAVAVLAAIDRCLH